LPIAYAFKAKHQQILVQRQSLLPMLSLALNTNAETRNARLREQSGVESQNHN